LTIVLVPALILVGLSPTINNLKNSVLSFFKPSLQLFSQTKPTNIFSVSANNLCVFAYVVVLVMIVHVWKYFPRHADEL